MTSTCTPSRQLSTTTAQSRPRARPKPRRIIRETRPGTSLVVAGSGARCTVPTSRSCRLGFRTPLVVGGSGGRGRHDQSASRKTRACRAARNHRPGASASHRFQAAGSGDRRLAVPHELLRLPSQPREVARQAPRDIRRLLAEHQRARDRARPAHLARSPPIHAGADRDRPQSAPAVPTDHTAQARPVDRSFAETSAARETSV